MDILFKGQHFDTTKDIEICYRSDSAMREMVEHLIDYDYGDGALISTFGFLSRNFPFISNLSIMENIILPLEYHLHMRGDEAVSRVTHAVKSLGIEGILPRRKEGVSNVDLYRAMFVRAAVMDPEVVFICDFKYSVTLGEFRGLIPRFRELLKEGGHLWIGVSEGHSLEWDHDVEVDLGA